MKLTLQNAGFKTHINKFVFIFQAGTASFYPPVNHEIKQQLKAHLTSIIRTLPEDLQFVLKNS